MAANSHLTRSLTHLVKRLDTVNGSSAGSEVAGKGEPADAPLRQCSLWACPTTKLLRSDELTSRRWLRSYAPSLSSLGY